jgi:Xaa-Pro aminopeptidase
MTMQPATLSHLSSAAERTRRYETLRTAMGEAGLDALVIAGRGDEFLRGRLQYVSDIFQWAGYGYVVLPAEGGAAYIGDPLWGLGRATAAGWIDDLRLSLTPGAEAVAALGDHGVSSGRVGLVGANDAAAPGHVLDLRDGFAGEVVEATDLFDDIRAIKSAEEIESLRETSAILKRVFLGLAAELRPGVPERDALAEAHRMARQLGCLEGIALMGRPPFPFFGPGSEVPMQADDVIVIDLEWAGPSGYWLELRRCFSFGPPSDAARRFWEIRSAVFDACVAAIGPGVHSLEIAAARDRALADHGYPPVPGLRYTAHGLGLDSLEPPWVPGKDRVLQPGMVLSLHPDVAIDDEDERARLGGISIADNVLVTDTGAERLTDPTIDWVVLER